MNTTNLDEVDLKKVTFPDGGSLNSAGGNRVFYDGKHIGSYHRAGGSYPPSATNLAGKSVGFAAPSEAIKFLLASLDAKTIDGNIFPDGFYILRVHEIMVSNRVTAKIHYNTKNSTGSSAASKPCLSEMVEIDLGKGEILTKKGISFENQDEIIEKVRNLVKEKING